MFVVAAPIPRLINLINLFNGVVVVGEQIEERLQKLFTNSIPLWRLIKATFQNFTMIHEMVISLKSLNFFSPHYSKFAVDGE